MKLGTRKHPNSILYLENFPIENAGYQYRAAKWAEIMREEGFQVDIWTLYEDKKEFEKRVNQKPFSRFLIRALIKRFKQVLASRSYDTVIVRRELLWFNDYGNLFMDKLLLSLHPNAILDFDDDISAAKNQPKVISNWYGRLLCENGNKFNDSLRLYTRFIVASNYLKTRVLSENSNIKEVAICVIPTCVDYDRYSSKNYSTKLNIFTVGWIGNDYNYELIDSIIPVLNKLSADFDFKLCIIGKTPYRAETNFEIQFVKWSLAAEVDDLLKLDIGIMPLLHDKESKGKAAFKLVQYMGLGIVSIASPVTINKEIVQNQVNSFLCNTDDEWYQVLKDIFEGKYNLTEIGAKAKNTIDSRYSFNSNKEKYINFIHQCAG
jgi:glycosyltransferase involved in cell wall biosynthesis